MNMPASGAHSCDQTSPKKARMEEIRQNLEDRIIEAKREGWLGEVEGLQISYSGVKDKLAQIDAARQNGSTISTLGMPTFGSKIGRSSV
jgi:hypothetical protein